MNKEDILSNEIMVQKISDEVRILFGYLGMSRDEARIKLERMTIEEIFDMYLAGEYFLTPLYELLLD
ncbi:MAG: hypothetical protein PUD22_04415 [Erysipelotrichaceae bacterium]|nr:hypothetical protein [Erysipelotrichaceae bacterium]